MNISQEYINNELPSLKDVHIKIKGKITYQLKGRFESDWQFAKGHEGQIKIEHHETSNKPTWCCTSINGPGDNPGHLSIIIFSAINAATENIVIMTPYFLPNKEIIRTLQVASLRSVNVLVVLPLKNNLNFFQWAIHHMFSLNL